MSEEVKYVRLTADGYGKEFPKGTLVRYTEADEVDGSVVVHPEDPIIEVFRWIFSGDYEFVEPEPEAAPEEMVEVPKQQAYVVTTVHYATTTIELFDLLNDLNETQLNNTTVETTEVK